MLFSCFYHPYCLSYFVFWLLTLFDQPRKGKREIRTFSSSLKGASAPLTPVSADEWGSGKIWVCGSDSPTSPWGAGWVRCRESTVPWDRQVQTTQSLSPQPGDHVGRKVWGCQRHRLSGAPPGPASPHHPPARTCRQMAQSTLPFIFRTLTALCKSQLCP